MKELLAVSLVLLVSCFFISSVQADTIVIASDTWCPINCEPNSPKPGYMVEIARKIFSKAGHKLEYKRLPWARAISQCRNGEISGIIGPYFGDAPDFVFPKNEMGSNGHSFFVRMDSKWTYKGISSLSLVSVGACIGCEYNNEINAYLEKNKSTSKVQLLGGDKPIELNIKKLMHGRIDTLIEAEPVFWYTAKTMGLEHKFKSAGIGVEPEKSFIAFSPALPVSKKYAKLLSAGIVAMRKSGELEIILKKYGLKDWK